MQKKAGQTQGKLALLMDIATVQKKKCQRNLHKVKHSSESVLQDFSAETEYGQSFRNLSSCEQKKEEDRLNKGAVKGTKEAIKSKLIATKYTQLCADKMMEYLMQMR
jgi:hypothetical protein